MMTSIAGSLCCVLDFVILYGILNTQDELGNSHWIPALTRVARNTTVSVEKQIDKIWYITYGIICSDCNFRLLSHLKDSLRNGTDDQSMNLIIKELKICGQQDQLLIFLTEPADSRKSRAVKVTHNFCLIALHDPDAYGPAYMQEDNTMYMCKGGVFVRLVATAIVGLSLRRCPTAWLSPNRPWPSQITDQFGQHEQLNQVWHVRCCNHPQIILIYYTRLWQLIPRRCFPLTSFWCVVGLIFAAYGVLLEKPVSMMIV